MKYTKYMAIAGLLLIFIGLAGLVFARFSYTNEVAVIDAGPITASINQTVDTSNVDAAALAAIIIGGLLAYYGRTSARQS
jgi:hypothetical protein